MKLAVRRTSAAIAAFATVGVSSLFVGAMPASAAVGDECGAAGTLIAPGICEATFTSGTPTFTATADMSKLEVLLVGAGGAGAIQDAANTDGYAAAGGGGEVKVLNFTGTVGAINLTVAQPGAAGTSSAAPSGTAGTNSSAVAGARVETAVSGSNATFDSGVGGASGTRAGWTDFNAGGAGAKASPTVAANGGAGWIVGDLAATGSLFDTDTECYGGGGATGTPTLKGIPGCNAGGSDPGTALSAPLANHGGGGGGLSISPWSGTGAAGFIAVRWTAGSVVSFSANGHGVAPANETVALGGTATRPADPTAVGYAFNGWYTDATLTTPVDFSDPVSAAATYFASWSAVLAAPAADLAATGVDVDQAPLAAAAVLAGVGLIVLTRRRRIRSI